MCVECQDIVEVVVHDLCIYLSCKNITLKSFSYSHRGLERATPKKKVIGINNNTPPSDREATQFQSSDTLR